MPSKDLSLLMESNNWNYYNCKTLGEVTLKGAT